MFLDVGSMHVARLFKVQVLHCFPLMNYSAESLTCQKDQKFPAWAIWTPNTRSRNQTPGTSGQPESVQIGQSLSPNLHGTKSSEKKEEPLLTTTKCGHLRLQEAIANVFNPFLLPAEQAACKPLNRNAAEFHTAFSDSRIAHEGSIMSHSNERQHATNKAQ